MRLITDEIAKIAQNDEEPNLIYRAMLAWIVDKTLEIEKLAAEIKNIADVCEDHARGIGDRDAAYKIMDIGQTVSAIACVLKVKEDRE